jgi:hypothetical protein
MDYVYGAVQTIRELCSIWLLQGPNKGLRERSIQCTVEDF